MSTGTQPAQAPGPVASADDANAAADRLQAVINQGHAQIQKQMAENEKLFQKSIAQMTGDTGDLTVDLSSLDDDLREMFNLFGGSPLNQLIPLMLQGIRRQTTTMLLVQSMAAKMAGMDSPKTDEALKDSSGG